MIINRTEKWGKNIQSACYNGARTVFKYNNSIEVRTNAFSAAPYIDEENKAELSDDSDENLCISLCDHTIQSHGGLRASELGQHNESYIASMDIQENHLLDEINSKTEAKDQIVEKEIVPSLDQNGYHFLEAFSILILLHKYLLLACF